MIFDDMDIGTVKTRIKVIGVGGAGKNAIDHMIENEVLGVEFYAVNTDAQDLKICKVDPKNKLLIGRTTTHGMGAGANPEIGRMAAEESVDDIHEMIGDAQMVFITCGMGGGTGTGAAPIIARVAREHGCLTVGICTKPFAFEGPVRMANAVAGLENISNYVDTLIVVPNQRLLQMVAPGTGILDAFREADNVLRKGVSGVAEVIQLPSLINIDFADVKTVMSNKGTALIGIGVAKGPNRAVEAARNAIHSPLLEVTIDGATDAIVNISASQSLSLQEVDAAIDEIRNTSSNSVNIIFGTAINTDLKDELVVTVIATGYELKAKENGYNDIKKEIFNHMSNQNITYDKHTQATTEAIFGTPDGSPAPSYEEESETRIEEIFEGVDPKLQKKEAKLAKKAERQAERDKRRAARKGEPLPKSNDSDSDAGLPSWLHK
ncbi:MAG: cell division protein FtsZ [Acholeplasmatales bacterium]|nr:cell division protein FtsZ [Acholeplasmatales bacterium]